MAQVWLLAVIAASAVMLAAGILIWLRAADRKLARLLEAAQSVERSAQTAAVQLGELLQPAAAAVRTVGRGLDNAEKIFDAAGRLGEAAEETSAAICRMSAALNATAARHVERAGGKYRSQIADAMDWAEVGLAAWQFWQTKRRDSRSSACPRHDEGHDKNS